MIRDIGVIVATGLLVTAACDGSTSAGSPAPAAPAAPSSVTSPPSSSGGGSDAGGEASAPGAGAADAGLDASGPTSACGDPGTGLARATYDVAHSRFAWGGPPVASADGTRWSGPDGVLTIMPFGYVLGSMNGGAAESTRPDWSTDADALTAHVRAYFAAMGVPDCQIASTSVTVVVEGGSSSGAPAAQRTIHLDRGIAGIPVVESVAYARLDDQDQSTLEGFFWPTLASNVLASARALHDELADATKLGAFKQKLPPNARGDGNVVIHHTSIPLGKSTFVAIATWDTLVDSSPESFDENGQLLPPGSW